MYILVNLMVICAYGWMLALMFAWYCYMELGLLVTVQESCQGMAVRS